MLLVGCVGTVGLICCGPGVVAAVGVVGVVAVAFVGVVGVVGAMGVGVVGVEFVCCLGGGVGSTTFWTYLSRSVGLASL